MPKFGQMWFNGYYFGDDTPSYTTFKKSIKRVPLGFKIRKQLEKKIIFRVRPGDGFFGSTTGKPSQQKYEYFVPSSIDNTEGGPYRVQLKAAIDHWQNVITDEEKAEYNLRASRGMHMSGYNLFIREAMKGIYSMFTDRGDPATYDYAKEDLTIDGAWHDLDLSAIVPSCARAVFIIGHLEGAAVDWKIQFRKKGNTNEIIHGGMETLRAGVERHRSSLVAIGSDQTIEYKISNESWTTLSLAIKGWWT